MNELRRRIDAAGVIIACMALAVMVLVTGAHGQTIYYLASNGNDSTGNGTYNSPWQTLEKARDHIRLYSPQTAAPVEVRLRGGTYYRSEPFVLDERDSGTSSVNTVTYMAQPGENVLISGGWRITTDWAQGNVIPGGLGRYWSSYYIDQITHNGKKVFDPIEGIRDLYCNNQRLIRARHPDTGFMPIQKSGRGDGDYAGRYFEFDNTYLVPSAWDKGVEIVAYKEWMSPRQRVGGMAMRGARTQVHCYWSAPLGLERYCYSLIRGGSGLVEDDDTATTVDRLCEDNPNCMGMSNPPGCVECVGYNYAFPSRYGNRTCSSSFYGDDAYLENAPEYMNQVNEWCYNFATKAIDVILPIGLDPRSNGDGAAKIVAPVAKKLVVLKGKNSQRVHHVNFSNLNFAHTEFPSREIATDLTTEGYTSVQAGARVDPRGFPPADGGNLLPGAVELFFADNCTISRCRVAHTGATGIMVLGDDNQIIGNELFDLGAGGISVGGWDEAYVNTAFISNRNVVSDNYIHHVGRVYHDTVGIWGAYTKCLKVEHNEISCAPYTGISVGWSWNPCSSTFNPPSCEPPPCMPPPPTCTGPARYPETERTYIGYNYIHDVMTIMGDGAAIYMNGYQFNTAGQGETCGLPPDALSYGGVVESNYIHSLWYRGGNTTYGTVMGLYWDRGRNWLARNNVIVDVQRPFLIDPAYEPCPGGSFPGLSWGTNYFRWNQYMPPSANARHVQQCIGYHGCMEPFVEYEVGDPVPAGASAVIAQVRPRYPHSIFVYQTYCDDIHPPVGVAVPCY